MVLHHVAQHARAVVVAAAAFHVDRLGDVELDVVDEVLVPQRLEHAVAEAEGQKILHGLLAEIVIDPVDLVLVPVGEDVLVELERGGEIGAEGLLHDDALPARPVLEASLVKLLAEETEEARGGGEVEPHPPTRRGHVKHVAMFVWADGAAEASSRGRWAPHAPTPRPQTLGDGGAGGAPPRRRRPRRARADDAGERWPRTRTHQHVAEEGVTRVKLLDVLAHPRAERVRRELVHRRAEEREAVGEQAVAGQVVERRHQQPLREVAGSAEDEHHARLARRIHGVVGHVGPAHRRLATHESPLRGGRMLASPAGPA